MSGAGFSSGAILDIRRGLSGDADGNTFTVKQSPDFIFFETTGKNGEIYGSRINMDYEFGPLKLLGYVDTSELEIVINVTVAGVSIGTYKGSFDNGIAFDLSLLVASGHIKLYVQSKALYLDFSIKIKFDGEYKKDQVKLFGWS